VFENDRSWLSVLILGKMRNLENEEPVEAGESTLTPEIHELTMLCVCGSVVMMKDPVVGSFDSKSHHPFSQKVQDFKIIFLIHYDTRRYEFFVNYPARIKKNDDQCLDFLFAHASFLLSWRLWRVLVFTLPLGFRVIFEELIFITYYEPIKKI
jgi:hypothetical protein